MSIPWCSTNCSPYQASNRSSKGLLNFEGFEETLSLTISINVSPLIELWKIKSGLTDILSPFGSSRYSTGRSYPISFFSSQYTYL